MQNLPISNHHFFLPCLTLLGGEIELQCESDYGITNLERSNEFLMLMKNSELVPQPAGREPVLLAQILHKWNHLTLRTCWLSPLMTFYSQTSCSDLIATPAVTLAPANGLEVHAPANYSWGLPSPRRHLVSHSSRSLCVTCSLLYVCFLHWSVCFGKQPCWIMQLNICETHTHTHTRTHTGCNRILWWPHRLTMPSTSKVTLYFCERFKYLLNLWKNLFVSLKYQRVRFFLFELRFVCVDLNMIRI